MQATNVRTNEHHSKCRSLGSLVHWLMSGDGDAGGAARTIRRQIIHVSDRLIVYVLRCAVLRTTCVLALFRHYRALALISLRMIEYRNKHYYCLTSQSFSPCSVRSFFSHAILHKANTHTFLMNSTRRNECCNRHREPLTTPKAISCSVLSIQ